jgi:hypothetical protein
MRECVLLVLQGIEGLRTDDSSMDSCLDACIVDVVVEVLCQRGRLLRPRIVSRALIHIEIRGLNVRRNHVVSSVGVHVTAEIVRDGMRHVQTGLDKPHAKGKGRLKVSR